VAAEEEADELLASTSDASTLEARLRRRESGEPLAWVTGRTRFCGHSISVAPGVYVPRPHTEALARRAAAVLPLDGRAVDLCTGSGAIAVHLMRERPTAHVVGLDIDERAAACARSNGVSVAIGDAGAPPVRGPLDVVTMVAPYVPTDELAFLAADVRRYEPPEALDGGADGLAVVRRVVAACAELVRPEGWLLLELGGDQDEVLAPTLEANGWGTVARWTDDDGDLRGIACRAS
jgi:release factor glutamine methyltransferase